MYSIIPLWPLPAVPAAGIIAKLSGYVALQTGDRLQGAVEGVGSLSMSIGGNMAAERT